MASSEPDPAAQPPPAEPLAKPAPGALWPWVKWASWVELAIFAALCFFWLAPGFDHEAMIFGWAHGLGFIALCVLIWIAILRHEAPYTLLDRKSTRLNSSHANISYAVFCLKK